MNNRHQVEQQRPSVGVRRYEGEPDNAFHRLVAEVHARDGGTVSAAIRSLTGYDVYYKTGFIYASPPWSHRHDLGNYDIGELKHVRLAYLVGKHEYYYKRDVLRAFLPRWRCDQCGKKAPLESKYIRYGDLVYRFSRCTKRCLRFAASPEFAALHDREHRKWEEHCHALICSPACHNTREADYRRITLDAKEKRKWVQEGTALVRQVVEASRSQRRSPSQRKGSTRLRTSAAS